MEKKILILAGPSAVGKSTVADALVAGGRFGLVRSVTTRERRDDPHDGEYFYVDEEEFSRMIADGELIEHSGFTGHRYGTPAAEIVRIEEEGKLPLLILDADGVRAFRASTYADRTYAVYLYGDLNRMEERLYARELSATPTVEALLRFTSRKERNMEDYLSLAEKADLFDLFLPCEDVGVCTGQILSSMAGSASQTEEEKEKIIRPLVAMAEEKKNYRAQ